MTSSDDSRDTANGKFSEYFSSLPRYSEEVIDTIASELKHSDHPSWSKTPRLYILLRTVEKLELLEELTKNGICDLWVPLSEEDIVDYPSLSQSSILSIQSRVLTNNTVLEKGRHLHLDHNIEMPFKNEGNLAEKIRGVVVHKVSSSGQVFARKTTLRRGQGFKGRRENMANFRKELNALKRLDHCHIVKLEGSYTNIDHAAFFMSPVGDCNLAEYFTETQSTVGHGEEEREATLRSFFGCLADALAYVHRSQVRHKDIKPTNILVQSSRVLLADFGASYDWSDMSQSETSGSVWGTTAVYRAPEVAAHIPRRSSSDIWSLGCVFLEMLTVIKGEKVENLKAHMRADSKSPLYWYNLKAVSEWIQQLRRKAKESDNIPLAWVDNMLKQNPSARWRATELRDSILRHRSLSDSRSTFCGTCCDRSDSSRLEIIDVAEDEDER